MTEVQSDEIHPHFVQALAGKPPALLSLYRKVRASVLSAYPESNELLYNTHVPSSVYSVSDRLKHAFCHIAVYTKHINLGFNQGTELEDPAGLLRGTGAKIRHIPISSAAELENSAINLLISAAVQRALSETGGSPLEKRRLVSKIT
ncbi:MAG: DUF1801 domain-containing protein [Pseudomonadota bacterium]